MLRPYCTKNLHTHCRFTPSLCDCLCHRDDGSGVLLVGKTPSPCLEAAEKIVRCIE